MESLSMALSCTPSLQTHLKTHKPNTIPSISLLLKSIPSFISSSQRIKSHQTPFPSSVDIHLSYLNHLQKPLHAHLSLLKNPAFSQNLVKVQLFFMLNELTTSALLTLPSSASESLVSSTDQVSNKINLEAVLVSIDDFFNRNPFFVAGCTFIWLVVIPLTQEYFRKYKFISAIDAFRKLRDDPNAQLLDIREEKSLKYMDSPNLKIINKVVVRVQFSEDDEDGFVKKVLGNFEDAANTVVCVLDNFDGNSMKVAELLFKNGFKGAYAIKGGVRGKKGWIEIQEALFPPSVHIYRKKVKTSQEHGVNGGVIRSNEDDNKGTSSAYVDIRGSQGRDNGRVTKSTNSSLEIKNGSRSSSPYPNYPDLKPPSSPAPSKPFK
ncbi:hypothetical protein FEM48_Zijuj09G0146000 [Ziziphus jujuba var. spinosa]|uniref:Rhodanese-like domain-containing protein 4A, chloroplastic n=1 Tax=Ziziphus jujuba var. spinosa TaxID=714518 RepID=A0A978UTJ7_ZIZJJ|nr:hypothetical protein FEM48_Zijuj09G0146000 [Ziziphus jujuba var. spinosa]